MNTLNHPWQRLTGLVLAAATLFVLDPDQANALHGFFLPLVLAVAALLLTRSPMAVLIAVFALSTIAVDLSDPSWIASRGYPLLAASSCVGVLAILWRRLQVKAKETHEERWAERRQE